MDDDNARAAHAKKGSPFLNTDQAAFYVGLSRRTLEKMRSAGGGPHYRKHGRYVRYHIADLEAWSNSSGKASTSTTTKTSTSQANSPAPHAGKAGRDDV